jgi:hypothetical protein
LLLFLYLLAGLNPEYFCFLKFNFSAENIPIYLLQNLRKKEKSGAGLLCPAGWYRLPPSRYGLSSSINRLPSSRYRLSSKRY